MRHLKLAIVVALAVLLVGQAVVHHHSLIPEGSSAAPVCPVCAFGADKASNVSPIVAPLTVAWTQVASVPLRLAAGALLVLVSRGPPSLA
ncbi:MAG: hypothetical protein JO197_20710 [Acidobacteria bacterium]|nr:hypothetical protein [Acidobacteriota bacterium]MBV9476988.1 hypothetical protein [Acidobacteriota bacterium]